jgi:transcriptional regulator with XRE-family HTH domain
MPTPYSESGTDSRASFRRLTLPEEVGEWDRSVVPESQTFWDRIHIEMQRRGWRAARLAEESGVSRATLSRWKKEPRSTPDTKNLTAVGEVLGLSVNQILGQAPIPKLTRQPLGHLTADDERTLHALRRDDKLYKVVRALIEQWRFPVANGEDHE